MTVNKERIEKLETIKVDDKITRLLAGTIPMPLIVTEVTKHEIICGPWKFSRVTGAEIDEDLGWDGVTQTGSYIQV